MPHRDVIGERSHGWMGIHRGHKARPLEWLAEKFIYLVSLSTILVVFLIFFFIGREALPIFLGQMDSALVKPVISPEEMDKLPPLKLRDYLGLTEQQFAAMDKETLRSLMEIKQEAQNEIPEQFRNDKEIGRAHV